MSYIPFKIYDGENGDNDVNDKSSIIKSIIREVALYKNVLILMITLNTTAEVYRNNNNSVSDDGGINTRSDDDYRAEITYWLIFSPHSQNDKWLRT